MFSGTPVLDSRVLGEMEDEVGNGNPTLVPRPPGACSTARE